MASGTSLGKTPNQVLEHLKNPLNQDLMVTIMDQVEDMWNQ
jgi:hypothetical protein